MNRISDSGSGLFSGKRISDESSDASSSGFSIPEIRSLVEVGGGNATHHAAAPSPKPRSDPDHADAEAFLAGSDEAFIRLYAKYEVSLFYYCKRMLHDEAAAEDAFQEIWTHVFEMRNKTPRPAGRGAGVRDSTIGHFRGLLFRSARNLCLNVIHNGSNAESIDATMFAHSEAGRDQEEPDFDEREEFSLAEPMSQVASGREIESLMVRALSRLPFEQRETFVLHEYSGFSYPEIAEMMNVPEQNVKVRAFRARARLRKFIQGWLGLGEDDDPANYI